MTDHWRDKLPEVPKALKLSEHEARTLQIIQANLVNDKLTLKGVRVITARLMPWLLGETWCWGKYNREHQLDLILKWCLRADLGWHKDGFWRHQPKVRDAIIHYLETHPTGKRVVQEWTRLAAMAQVCTRQDEWTTAAEDHMRELCKAKEQGYQELFDAIHREVSHD